MQTWDGTTAQWPSEWQIPPSDEHSGPCDGPLVAHPLIEPYLSIQPPSQICGPFTSQADHFSLPALYNLGQPVLLDHDPRLLGDAQTSRPHDDRNVTNQPISPELLENNLKFGPQPSQGFKRKRPQSCDNCRSRKVRCTRTPPDSSTTDRRCLPCQSVDG
ncbi:hypothetical protein IE81DRAFT_13773 [Ceraceosorus guamensis]|uniref:Zn(2)-C6 fungal-type domain-containing protein n=1 Tax=Ceraceosorus guamensis TaxID=1522189 RepID=A0A316VQ00_9BASI|nr:hypothetical protein IE81DRAFT_13773 [Ceraceosorus guamensis]PWN39657.1 hypothetical protein IE81DRAFT_13773 [Ceraceosorus guamensis]